MFTQSTLELVTLYTQSSSLKKEITNHWGFEDWLKEDEWQEGLDSFLSDFHTPMNSSTSIEIIKNNIWNEWKMVQWKESLVWRLPKALVNAKEALVIVKTNPLYGFMVPEFIPENIEDITMIRYVPQHEVFKDFFSVEVFVNKDNELMCLVLCHPLQKTS